MTRAMVLSLLLLGAGLTGCIGTDDTNSDIQSTQDPGDVADWGVEIPETIGGIQHLSQATDQGRTFSGAGMWMEGDYAYVSALGDGLRVIDVSDPEQPTVVGSISGDELYARDVDMIHTGNQTVAVLATQSGGMTFVDVTDPTEPAVLSILEDVDPNHNVAAVPGTTIVYNSPSGGEGRTNEIVDASDPTKPEIVGEFGEYGCHDISFYVNETDEKHRAYCARSDVTEIWDIADPTSPELITPVSNICMDDDARDAPRSNCGGLHHTAFVNHDASILIIGDEFQGGSGPGCGYHAEAEGNSLSTPIGALWFYDISDEENPERLGWFAPNVPTQEHLAAITGTAQDNPTATPFSASCTSHFGDLVPGHEMLVIGWYQAGVIVVDFSDPANPMQVDQFNDGTGTWDAQVHKGYIFSGDMNRGLDAFRILGE